MSNTVAFVQDWMMSGDHEPTQWEHDFAAAIDARSASSPVEGLTSGEGEARERVKSGHDLSCPALEGGDDPCNCGFDDAAHVLAASPATHAGSVGEAEA